MKIQNHSIYILNMALSVSLLVIYFIFHENVEINMILLFHGVNKSQSMKQTPITSRQVDRSSYILWRYSYYNAKPTCCGGRKAVGYDFERSMILQHPQTSSKLSTPLLEEKTLDKNSSNPITQ